MNVILFFFLVAICGSRLLHNVREAVYGFPVLLFVAYTFCAGDEI